MESLLSELEEFVLRRWTWRLRRRARSRAFWKNYAMKPPRQRDAEGFGLARHCAGFSMPGWQKEKACISAGFLALGSPVDHFDSSFCPVTVAMFLLSGCFSLVCPVGVPS